MAQICQSLGKPSRADDEKGARIYCKHVAVCFHEKMVLKLEAEYREAKTLLVTPVPSDHSDVGSAGEKEESDGGVVSDMEVQNVEDMGVLPDLDLFCGVSCKGVPPPEPKRVRTEPPKSKAPPPISPSPNVDRDMLLAAIKIGSLA